MIGSRSTFCNKQAQVAIAVLYVTVQACYDSWSHQLSLPQPTRYMGRFQKNDKFLLQILEKYLCFKSMKGEDHGVDKHFIGVTEKN